MDESMIAWYMGQDWYKAGVNLGRPVSLRAENQASYGFPPRYVAYMTFADGREYREGFLQNIHQALRLGVLEQ